jgi:hypothetical protein
MNERFLQSSNGFFHEECLTCASCSQSLAGQNYTLLQNGGYVCDTCLYKHLGPQQGYGGQQGYGQQQQYGNNNGYDQYGGGNNYGGPPARQSFPGGGAGIPQNTFGGPKPPMQQQQPAYGGAGMGGPRGPTPMQQPGVFQGPPGPRRM